MAANGSGQGCPSHDTYRDSRRGVDQLVNMDKAQVVRGLDHHFLSLIEIARMPSSQELEQEPLEPNTEGLKVLGLAVLPRLVEKEAIIQTQLRGTLIMAAVDLHRANQPYQGRYPPTLQDLVPDYLP